VEFALILPIIMFLLLGMLEMGFAINHNTSIVTATRQGARVGAELVNGSSKHDCTDNANAGTVDALIIGAAEGVLRSPGSPVTAKQVTSIVIFEVDENGAATGHQNTWTYTENSTTHLADGPVMPNTTQNLFFKPSAGGTFPAAGRCGSAGVLHADGHYGAYGIGVKIVYTYQFLTPLGSLLKGIGNNSVFANGQITMSDQTIMALEP
jgi:hypothetical protein